MVPKVWLRAQMADFDEHVSRPWKTEAMRKFSGHSDHRKGSKYLQVRGT